MNQQSHNKSHGHQCQGKDSAVALPAAELPALCQLWGKTLSGWRGQHPRSASCLAQRAQDWDVPPSQARLWTRAWVSPWLPSLPPRLQEIWAAKSLPGLPVSLLGAGKKTRQSWGGGKVCRKLNCKVERQFRLCWRVLNFLVGKIKSRVWIYS